MTTDWSRYISGEAGKYAEYKRPTPFGKEIEWDVIKDKWKWCAVDGGTGQWMLYENKPELFGLAWMPTGDTDMVLYRCDKEFTAVKDDPNFVLSEAVWERDTPMFKK